MLHEFKERGPVALEEWNKKAQASPARHGAAHAGSDLAGEKNHQLEDEFIPKELQRDYDKTFGHNRH